MQVGAACPCRTSFDRVPLIQLSFPKMLHKQEHDNMLIHDIHKLTIVLKLLVQLVRVTSNDNEEC